MSRIQWDTEGQKFYEFGVSKGVLFIKDTNGYANGVPWNGLTAVNENPTGGESQDLWADDILYGSFRSTERYGATIEAYTYPDEFAACDGSAEIAPGAYLGQQGRKRFGFAFVTKIGSDADDSDPSAYRLSSFTVRPQSLLAKTILLSMTPRMQRLSRGKSTRCPWR